MKPSKVHYFLPYLSLAVPWGTAFVFVVLAIWKYSKDPFNLDFAIGLLAFLVLGWLIGVLVYRILLVPIIIRINGGPFKRGNWVCILVGPHKGSVVRVYYIRPKSDQLFVELGEEAKKNFKDMFAFAEVCRKD